MLDFLRDHQPPHKSAHHPKTHVAIAIAFAGGDGHEVIDLP
jgi:hypothetical protein